MFAHNVLRTLYSPVKAFEEIVKNPDIKGPLLILALILVLTAGFLYATASKFPVEIRKPEEDDWTESMSHWISNGKISNSSDRVVGDYSVMSSVTNGTCIWMRLTGIGPINCSGDENYKRLRFRIKWAHQEETFPDSEAALKLFFDDESNCLKLDLSTQISNFSGKWYNSTVDTGPESQDWNCTDSPDWERITGLEFKLAWLDPANFSMKIDDLYFGRYVPALVAFPFHEWLIERLMLTGLGFFLSWGVYGGLLLLVVKISGEKVGSWKQSFLVIGYLFSVTVIYQVVMTLATIVLPTWPYLLTFNFTVVGIVWIAALSAIAIRSLYALSWTKTISVSVLTNIVAFVINPLMLVWPLSWFP